MKPETTYQAVLGRLLSEKRQQKGWDQATAADKSGTNRSSWSRLENGATAPDTIQLAQIAKAFDTTPHDFLKEVQDTCSKLEHAGVKVHMDKKPSATGSNMGWLLLGGALGALLAAAASASSDDDNSKD